MASTTHTHTHTLMCASRRTQRFAGGCAVQQQRSCKNCLQSKRATCALSATDTNWLLLFIHEEHRYGTHQSARCTACKTMSAGSALSACTVPVPSPHVQINASIQRACVRWACSSWHSCPCIPNPCTLASG
eukprot:1308028-Rhodomonas_salina.3